MRSQKNRTTYVAMIACTLLLFSSCNEQGVFQGFEHFNSKSWSKDQKVSFNFEISDTASQYSINYLVRHSIDYAFQNLWVEGNIIFPDSQVVPFKKNIQLGDAKGYWYGNGISDIMNVDVPIQTHAIFPQTGKYTFEFQQIMRVDPIEGVLDFGLKIKKENIE